MAILPDSTPRDTLPHAAPRGPRLAYVDGEHQLDLFGALDEASLYHGDAWGFFSLLYANGRRGAKRQRTYPLNRLPWAIEHVDPRCDTWISQAQFSKFNRRLVNLLRVGLCFLDLDTYRTPLGAVSEEAQAALLIEYCDGEGIPVPSVIVGSGRGLYAKWLLRPVLSRRALPYWNAVQAALAARLRRFGADTGALDGSRVLRLVGVVNAKSATVCRVLHVVESDGEPIRYDVDTLGECVLPVSRAELRRRRAERAERSEREPPLRAVPGTGRAANLRSFSGRQLAWDRLLDLRRLVDLRYGTGPVPEGVRMTTLFWQLNFLLLSGATHSRGMWHEAAAVAKRLDPDWGYASTELGTLYRKAMRFEAGERVEFAGRLYPALYTPRNATLITLFQITDEEQRELATIVSRDEDRRRDAVRKRVARAKAREAREERREALTWRIVELRDEQKLSWPAIALQVPVSMGNAYALYRAFKKPSLLLGGVGGNHRPDL